jgi:single-stranded-DNA-specific exonuclease
MSELQRRWQIAPPAPPSQINRFPQLHPITVQVLYNRGLCEPADVAAFLRHEWPEPDPFELEGVPAAVDRLRRAVHNQELIAVYGDFDVDGTTAAAVMVQTLRALGGLVVPYIPHRVDEGYGLNKPALAGLARQGVSLVVTVDCGVRSRQEVAFANRLGLDVVVTDHHSTGPELPLAVAVIDPKQPGSRYPFDDLAGVGIAYRLAQALLHSHRTAPLTDAPVHLEEEDLLDLVALGTVADLVPLRGENRALVNRGLERLNRMERPGVEALCEQARVRPGRVDTAAIGYALGPRLNAAGRLAHADTAYELLATPYPAEARVLAAKLDTLNRERQRLTREVQDLAREQVLAEPEGAHLIFVADPGFPLGIVGLVAGRLADEFYRPAVIAEVGKRTTRGSARSIAEFHITEALDQCQDLLLRYGGHAGAAGFTAHNEKLEPLAERLRILAADSLSDIELVPVLAVDAEVVLEQMCWELQRELAGLEPCGYDNAPPLFLSRGVGVRDQRAVGSDGRHLKLSLTDGAAVWDAIAFRQGDWAGKLPDHVDIIYHLEVNEWRDERRLQLNVQDIRPAGLDYTGFASAEPRGI